VEACELAIPGYVTIEQARHALVQFAQASCILWPDLEPVAGVHAVARGYGGYAA
ncbi:DUF982 domain-containing protein, partial [Mesorhizobium sp. M7A.F.Ca.CA.003.01.2.1]